MRVNLLRSQNLALGQTHFIIDENLIIINVILLKLISFLVKEIGLMNLFGYILIILAQSVGALSKHVIDCSESLHLVIAYFID